MGTIVATRSGLVEGIEAENYCVFKGIPFAAPPVGALRFQPPQRERAWSATRLATDFATPCSQNAMILETMMGADDIAKSEDCLALNIWTPSIEGTRPVMVWIHGGAFQFGSGSTAWYDGARFATNGDVVIVTINYRLGPLGFLYLGDLFGPDFADSGNLGMLDQIAALEWVHDNIAAFGGDPNNVTIFGESAGGASVATLMGMPAAQPGKLFHKVIAQSGAASWSLTRDDATAKAKQVLDALGIAPGDTAALLGADADAIVGASAVLGAETDAASLPFAPVIDGRSLPIDPLQAVRDGSARGVALLTGTNLDEMTLFNLMDPGLASIDEPRLVARVAMRFPDDAEKLVAGYRAERPDISLADLWTVMSTDVVFRIPAISLVEAHAAHGENHVYLFTWGTPAFGGLLKSCHAVEIPFVFDNLAQTGVEIFLGDGSERAAIAQRINAAWSRFAHTASPQHEAIPAWPPYDLETRSTMVINTEWQLQHDPAGAERQLHTT